MDVTVYVPRDAAALSLGAERVAAAMAAEAATRRAGVNIVRNGTRGMCWLEPLVDAPADQKYVTCNADEGDSGTFSDRMLMEGDPFVLLEGMTIAALAVGATQGFIYLRVEYPHAHRALTAAIEAAYARGYLGA